MRHPECLDFRMVTNKDAKLTQQTRFVPFSEILGQERAIKFLKQAMAREKMPHAYLFVGIHGVGKTATAMALTQAVNCLEPVKGEGCGHCRSCRQILGGNFPDLFTVNPDGQFIKIEQIRELNRSFSFKPVSGRYRVSIIRQAESMTEEAANSFLKTLEEPPEGNILILNVTEPLDLLPTIVSRCQKVSFRPIPAPLLTTWLIEHNQVTESKAAVLARISEGSLGKALEMGGEGFFEKRQDYISQLQSLPKLSPVELFSMAMTLSGKGKKSDPDARMKGHAGLIGPLGIWKTCYRDLLLLKMGAGEDRLINIDYSDQLKKLSENYRIHALIQCILLLDQAQRDVLRGRNPDLLMENTVLTLRRLAGR